MENKEKTHSIENFIGIYDNYISKDECNKAIEVFENQDKFNKTLDRIQFEDSPILVKQDKQYFAGPQNIKVWWQNLKSLIINFDVAFKHYAKHTGASDCYPDFHFTELKIQKTLKTEGYHTWHIEHGKGWGMEPRNFVFSVYLNDVEEGGETEFLHFSKRVKPKAGRIVIWPAGFPYVHRGNPPISGEKYLLTSWLNVRAT